MHNKSLQNLLVPQCFCIQQTNGIAGQAKPLSILAPKELLLPNKLKLKSSNSALVALVKNQVQWGGIGRLLNAEKIPTHSEMNNHQIYQLRHVELDPRVVAKIWPFINAYRPHDDAPTWREFKADGIDKVDEESLMDVIVDQYEADKECYEA
jgi:hypothetical protein